MPPASRPDAPCEWPQPATWPEYASNLGSWFCQRQKSYLKFQAESVLEEVADIGRLMAVAGFPVEGVLDAYCSTLIEEICQCDSQETAELIRRSVVCLTELLVAWRIGLEGVCEGRSGEKGSVLPPLFLWFSADGALSSSAQDGLDGDLSFLSRIGTLADLVSMSEASYPDLWTAIQSKRILSFEIRCPTATERLLQALICPFRDGSGVVGIYDVSLRRAAAEADLQRRKLESLGWFAGGLAHEINNLLQPILMTAQIMGEDNPQNPELSADIGIILDNARSAADVVRNVLAFARRASPRFSPLCPAVAIHQHLLLIRKTLPPIMTLTEDIDACGDTTILADHAELGLVLRNLIGNAADALEHGGIIAVSAAPEDIDEAEATKMSLPAGRYLRLSISDNGPGIAPSIASRIFDPFFTTKAIGEGTGLGLALVRSIIRSWGGHIGLRGGSYAGTVFDIVLPVTAAASQSSAPKV